MNPEKFFKLPSFNKTSKVSILCGLQKEEQEAVEKRSSQVLAALNKLSTKAKEAWNLSKAQAPVIAVLGSGGGLRAHFAFLGVLSELKRLDLLDAVTYLSGVSGSTWALSSFYTEDGNTEGIEVELKRRFAQKEWNLNDSLEKTIEAAKLENYSLTDFWAYIVVSKQTRELQDSPLSSMTKHVEGGTFPYPIFAAIDGDLYYSQKKEEAKNTWFEFTPHHAGYPTLGAYIPVNHFGSKFQKGSLVNSEPERDLSFLKGLWGSALASLEEIKRFILDQLTSLKEKLNIKHSHLRGMTFDGESPEVARFMNNIVTTEEELLDLVMTFIEDPNSPSVLQKLQALQQKLEAGRGEEVGGTAHRWLPATVQNWSKISPGEQGKQLQQLIQGFMEQEKDSGLSHSLSKLPGLSLPTSKFFLENPVSEFFDICNVLIKTVVCFGKWEWGTIYNFLYGHGDIKEQEMSNRELLHLMDAGFAINTPYPLVLLPARKVQLILSFDFSSGDPFETIRSTAKYCEDHKIPFPPVEEAMLEEWARTPPDSCYILKGENGPVVMHFPLFNKDSCGDDIQKWNEMYGTIKMADSYTLDMVTQLLELSKENVRRNEEKILSEIKTMVSSP
uniref:PLA2c domain-containing protein n=1 Tax=Chinchilla lanigera TaxID=34839 RepID=A0A8C2ULB4_CHILA